MKKQILLVLGICMAAFWGCDENNSGASNENDMVECDPACQAAENCVDGKCLCGDKECGIDESCVDAKCEKASVPPEEDPCKDKSCGEGEHCDAGQCLCGDTECSEGETCVDAKCEKASVPPDDDPCKDKSCGEGEHCDAGKCLCGDKECSEDEICVDDKCEKTSVPPDDDPCKDKTCDEGEHCDAGKCVCGDTECGKDEICVDAKCEKTTVPPDDPCKGKTCGKGEHCDAGQCLCGERKCGNDETCVDGGCIPIVSDVTPECMPPCGMDEVCEDGACKPIVSEPDCKKISCGAEQYCENGICKTAPMNCGSCKARETCVSGVCMCGKKTCSDDEECQKDECKPIDPCSRVKCASNEKCVDGKCKAATIKLEPAAMDVMLSSVSNKLVATSLNNSELVWTVDGKAADADMPVLKCRKSDKTLSKKLSDCIIEKDNTETVQFVGYTRHLKTVKIAVKNSNGDTAETVLTLKPYFDTGGFIKTNDMFYRDGYCPGQQMTASSGDDNAKYYYYDEGSDEKTCNLGGNTDFGKNEHGKQIFSEEETAVIDRDMYLKYIRPKMFRSKDGGLYGTRASVVAAARFLILQFPYDIPYTSNGIGYRKQLLSHYLFTSGDFTEVSKVDIHGLNLTSNVYNSATIHDESNIIKKSAIPWGGAYCDPDKKENRNECKDRNENYLKYPYNGLECSGFVTWALRNGNLGLGDWNTYFFAKKHELDDNKKCVINGKRERFYKCKEIVNNEGNKYSDIANQNNSLLLAYPKLKLLKDDDFIQIDSKKVKTLNDIFKDAKAGDLLVRNNCFKKPDKTYDCDNYIYGHVGMIIGIKRGSDKKVTAVYVGEGMPWSGNQLTKFESVEDFKNNSMWVVPNQYVTFLVKMDNVYNYYSNGHEIEKESANSDCPNNDKSSGNCYAYTETYNDEFNKALKTRQWGK